MSMSHVIEIELRTEPAHRRELLQTLEEMQALLAADSAALDHRLYAHATDPDRLLWIEAWPAAEATEDVVRSTRFRALLGAIKVLGRLDDLRTVQHDVALTEPSDRPAWLELRTTQKDRHFDRIGGNQK